MKSIQKGEALDYEKKEKKEEKKGWSFADFKLQLLNEQLFGKFQ